MIRRSKPLKRATRVRPFRSGGPRRGPKGVEPEKWRNASYRRFLRSNGRCVACDKAAEELWGFPLGVTAPPHPGVCDPSHGPVNGTGSKGPDAEAIPVHADA